MKKTIWDIEEDDKIRIDDGNGGKEIVTVTDVSNSGSVRYYDESGDAYRVSIESLEREGAEVVTAGE